MDRYQPRELTSSVIEAQKYYPVILVTGPRQSGKSTLCRHIFQEYRAVNLEDINAFRMAESDPVQFLPES